MIKPTLKYYTLHSAEYLQEWGKFQLFHKQIEAYYCYRIVTFSITYNIFFTLKSSQQQEKKQSLFTYEILTVTDNNNNTVR